MAQSRVTTLDLLAQDFTSMFRHRVFRLETMDFYDAPNEREPYACFLAGEHVDPSWREPWMQLVRGVRESGRIMQRVHLVGELIPDYIAFCMLHGYPYNVDAGEEVRIGSRTERLVGHGDWWLFDDRAAAVLVYDASGTAQRVEMHEDPVVLAELCAVRDEVLRLAVPLARYVSEHKITERKRHEQQRMGRRAVVQGERLQRHRLRGGRVP